MQRDNGMETPGGAVIKKCQLLVTHVRSPTVFWAQEVANMLSDALYEITVSLQSVCATASIPTRPLVKDRMYGAKFSEDGHWYRCKIVKFLNNDKVNVVFIDYGNGEMKEFSELVELPPSLTRQKSMAKRFVLFGLVESQAVNSNGNPQASEYLKNLVDNQICEAEILQSADGSTDVPVILKHPNGKDINQAMLDSGFVQPFARQKFTSVNPGNISQFRGGGGGGSGGGIGKNTNHTSSMPPFTNKQGGGGSGDFGQSTNNTGFISPFTNKQATGGSSGFGQNTNHTDSTSPFSNKQVGGGSGGFGQNTNHTGSTTSFSNKQGGGGMKKQQKAVQSNQKHQKGQMKPNHNGPTDQHQNHLRHRPSKATGDCASKPFSPLPPPSSGSEYLGGGDSDESNSGKLAFLENQLKTAQGRVSYLQYQLDKQGEQKKNSMENLQKERDASALELSSAKQQIKNLESKNDKLLSKFADNDLSSQIKRLVGSISKVRLLREQFPCGEPDILERALETLSSERQLKLDGMPVMSSVKSAIETYSFIQNRIRGAQQLNDVADLIPARHEARKQLNERLEEFFEETKKLPLEGRYHELKEREEELGHLYSEFLESQTSNTLELDEAALRYDEWKGKKYSDFQEVRTYTNTSHNAVNCALSQLQQLLCLNGAVDDKINTPDNLGVLLKDFQAYINQETEITDISKASDAGFIAMICKSIQLEIVDQKKAVDHFLQMYNEYDKLLKSIKPWLTEKPDVSPIQKTRKHIRKLKSKLRHTLADKHDLEENDDCSTGELESVQDELKIIRCDLHKAFIEEETLLNDLIYANEVHFPELIIEHSDLKSNKGCKVLKEGRSLDHYDLEPLGDQLSHLKKSCWVNQPVVLKEYLVDAATTESNNNSIRFLEQVEIFSNISSPYVIPVQAIFYGQTDRQAFVQCPFYKQSLSSFVGQTKPSDEMIVKIGYAVLQALHTLHSNGIIHGAIHPNNIFLTETDTTALLAEFDFSKTLDQRCQKGFKTSAGLNILAPEADGPFFAETDMYCFGLVLYWLHSPCSSSVSFTDDPAVAQNMALKQLLMYLLDASKSRRCTSDEAMKFAFFAKSAAIQPETSKKGEDDCLQLRKQSSPKTSSPGRGILKNSMNSTQGQASSPCDDNQEGATDDEPGSDHQDAAARHADEEQQKTSASLEGDTPLEPEQESKDNPVLTPLPGKMNLLHSISDGTASAMNSPIPDLIVKDNLNLDDTLPCTPMGTPGNTPVNPDELRLSTAQTIVPSPVLKLVNEAAKLAAEIPPTISEESPAKSPAQNAENEGKHIE